MFPVRAMEYAWFSESVPFLSTILVTLFGQNFYCLLRELVPSCPGCLFKLRLQPFGPQINGPKKASSPPLIPILAGRSLKAVPGILLFLLVTFGSFPRRLNPLLPWTARSCFPPFPQPSSLFQPRIRILPDCCISFNFHVCGKLFRTFHYVPFNPNGPAFLGLVLRLTTGEPPIYRHLPVLPL